MYGNGQALDVQRFTLTPFIAYPMSNLSRQARTDAFYRLPETCPKVRAAIAEAIEADLRGTDLLKDGIDEADLLYLTKELTDAAFYAAVEHGTNPLRAALIEAEEERLKETGRADDAERERDEAQRDAQDAQDDIKALEQEVAALEMDRSSFTRD